MEDLYFITDLDRTIIHSKNKGFKCVEKIGEKEITYMTDLAYQKMLEILKIEKFKFIPCTMRNLKQTLRVDFIKEYNPEVIICTNGAQIYLNGDLDLYWDKKMKNIIDFEEVKENIKFIENMNLNYLEIRNIEGFYITIKCSDIDIAEEIYFSLKGKFRRGIKIIHIGVKIFLIDEKINKINATDYIIDKYGILNLVTSGDTAVDKDFTTRGESIIPAHSSFKHKNSIITKNKGIQSTEEILEYIVEKLNIIS